MVYCKTCRHNTNYYRRNKEERFNVKCCPHCNYETTGPKSALLAHIYSKHTPENERPFQCPCIDCERGYAARANLQKHICKHHDTSMKVYNKCSFCYTINVNIPNTLSKNMFDFYTRQKGILTRDIGLNKKLSEEQFCYDICNNNINVEELSREDVINKINNIA